MSERNNKGVKEERERGGVAEMERDILREGEESEMKREGEKEREGERWREMEREGEERDRRGRRGMRVE